MTLIKACLNGTRRPEEHPALPLTPAQIAADSRAAVAAGASIVHVHPRDRGGRETLAPDVLTAVVRAIRGAAPGVPIGVSTGAWIEADPAARLAAVRSWTVLPDLASVNLSEEGSIELAYALAHLGVGVEAGVWTEADAERLVEHDLAAVCTRVLIEVEVGEPAAALAEANRIQAVLDRHGVAVPRLLHAANASAWPVLDAAIAAGLDTRIGLEDTLYDPQGRKVAGNATLVRIAVDRARAARPAGNAH
ncbi:3-keto-5-aminohexanoate cleavage protein [Embleya sp. NBC_00896]|uniref:3-keto-5-aminohexanoate cleavage protein n=1 Tax=Embleya sp. NBC_00896 TaxID=2975961 RepID=UPI00386333FF|nr:3-keto-5-aminohexanoate cleavage protein [Embleya sp. NBC_00896]